MDFVTITDHDTVDGALEIAHLPGTFLSSEVTAAFPEDGCQIHLLVYGVTEAQFRDIQRLRDNLYELRDYLYEEDVVCSVAHLLFQVNDALTVEHVETLCDTYGNAVLEAQASGLPAIVYNLGGPQEIVSASGAGRVVDVRAPGELARAMGELMPDAEGRAEMGRRAVAAARQASWEAVFEELWRAPQPPADEEPAPPRALHRHGDRRSVATPAADGRPAGSNAGAGWRAPRSLRSRATSGWLGGHPGP